MCIHSSFCCKLSTDTAMSSHHVINASFFFFFSFIWFIFQCHDASFLGFRPCMRMMFGQCETTNWDGTPNRDVENCNHEYDSPGRGCPPFLPCPWPECPVWARPPPFFLDKSWLLTLTSLVAHGKNVCRRERFPGTLLVRLWSVPDTTRW